MRRTRTHAFLLAAWLLGSGLAQAGPSFPWTSFRAIPRERSVGEVDRCNPADDRTRITAFFIQGSREFYRLWAMLNGRDWVAVHYDGEARPDWVWLGVWAGDDLVVRSVVSYDPVTHASACELLFGTRP
ncbi:MAG: hypothetical protein ACREH7_00225 [Candidatus Rokuibacteriota bacterium]